MKTFKYLTVILAAALAATGCYDDEGSYYTGSWTEIAAVEGMSIPGCLLYTSPSPRDA